MNNYNARPPQFAAAQQHMRPRPSQQPHMNMMNMGNGGMPGPRANPYGGYPPLGNRPPQQRPHYAPSPQRPPGGRPGPPGARHGPPGAAPPQNANGYGPPAPQPPQNGYAPAGPINMRGPAPPGAGPQGYYGPQNGGSPARKPANNSPNRLPATNPYQQPNNSYQAPPMANNNPYQQPSNPYQTAPPQAVPQPPAAVSNNPYQSAPQANPYQSAPQANPYQSAPPPAAGPNNPYQTAPQAPPQANPYLQSGPYSGGYDNPYQGAIAPQMTSSSQVSLPGIERDLVSQNTGSVPNPSNNSATHYNNSAYNNYDDAINLSLADGGGHEYASSNDQQIMPPRGYSDLYPQKRQQQRISAGDPNTATKKAEPKKPLDINEYNARRVAAENSEDADVQLLWIKAIIEATQEPTLINTIDINGNLLPNKLTTSKEIRKNRDVFLHKGLKRLKRLVSKNHPEANYYLGTLYTNGKILEKNYDKAFDYYLKAANGGSGDGMYRVAICYEMGIGAKQDNVDAFSWFKKSSQRHVVPAMFKLGMIYLKGTLQQRRSAARAIEWLEKAASEADENNPHALFELGKLYEGFYPISSSMDSLTNEDAQFLKDLKTIIPDTNDEKALNLYIRAAKLNYAPAQSKLGWCYEYGKLGCAVDSKRSIAWYCRSAAQGYALAEMALCGWYLTGAKGLLESNDKEAYLWALKAAEKGLSKAEYALGHFKETGLGTERDVVEARKWYMKAAAQGHPKAIQRMQELNSKGQ